jgi:sec-independent protein translocase protein TatC
MPGGRRHNDDRHMTLRDHVQELSRRFLMIVSILLVASTLVYIYRSSIIPIILQPLDMTFGDQKLMYLNPAGGFNFIFLISMYTGVAVAAPFAIQQLYVFIRPVLPKAARKSSARLLLMSFSLMIAGVLFGYYVAVPGALKFLIEFAGDYVSASLTADSYLNFLIAYTLGLGLLFQIPFVIIIGHHIKPFTPSGLLKSERWAILLTFIAAAIITPTPDPINLFIVALPIIAIYQIGVVSVLVSIYKKRRQQRRQLAAATPRLSAISTENIAVSALADANATTSFVRSPRPLADMPVRRSVDGFMNKSSRTTVTTPKISSQPAVRVTERVKNASPRRCIDGVSMFVTS